MREPIPRMTIKIKNLLDIYQTTLNNTDLGNFPSPSPKKDNSTFLALKI